MKRFIIGFIIGLLAFGLANVVSHFIVSSPAGRTDRVLIYGFPFSVWAEGGLPRLNGGLDLLALCGDIAIGFLCGTALGLLFWKRAT